MGLLAVRSGEGGMTPEQIDCPITREIRNKIFSELALELPPREFEILLDLYVRYTTNAKRQPA